MNDRNHKCLQTNSVKGQNMQIKVNPILKLKQYAKNGSLTLTGSVSDQNSKKNHKTMPYTIQ